MLHGSFENYGHGRKKEAYNPQERIEFQGHLVLSYTLLIPNKRDGGNF